MELPRLTCSTKKAMLSNSEMSSLQKKISLQVSGRAPRAKPTPPPTPIPGGNSFNACTETQKSQLFSARDQTKTYASDAENYLLPTIKVRVT